MVSLRDKLRDDLGDAGLIFSQEYTVTAVFQNPASQELDDSGSPGTVTETRTVLSPSPSVHLKAKFQFNGQESVKIADGLIKFSRVFEKEYLLGAAYFEIDGMRFGFVEGSLERKGLTWRTLIKQRPDGLRN